MGGTLGHPRGPRAMTLRLAVAVLILAALWLLWVWRDPDELPIVDDDWTMETDPYLAGLTR